MNQHTPLQQFKLSIYEAYKALYIGRPELANKVVTGGAYWPHENGIDWLYNEAVDLAKDRVEDDEERFHTKGITTIRTHKAIAARDALAILANAETDRREAEQNCIDYGPDRQQERV